MTDATPPVDSTTALPDTRVDVLISYKSEERPIAERLARALSRRWNVWWDHHLLAGDSYRRIIGEKLTGARAVIVLWSRRSTESEFVLDEAGRALKRGVLIPVRIEPVDIPLGFGQLDYTDLFDWDGDETHPGFVELTSALARRLGAPSPPGAAVSAASAGGVPVTSPAGASDRGGPGVPRWLIPAAVVAALLLVVMVVLMMRRPDDPQPPTERDQASATPATTPPSATPAAPAVTPATDAPVSRPPIAVQVLIGSQVLATGTVIPSGLVVTPCHVVGDAKEVTIKGAGAWDGVAKVIARRCDVDLALLEPARGPLLPNRSVVRFAGSLEPGEAIERYRGEGDRTPGKVITPRERSSYLGDGRMMTVLVTTHVSEGGDSGAPVLDREGRIVGLLVAGDGSTQSLSIPSETIREAFIERFAP